jgi:hypothetical protein
VGWVEGIHQVPPWIGSSVYWTHSSPNEAWGLVRLPPPQPGTQPDPQGTPGLGRILAQQKNGCSFNPLRHPTPAQNHLSPVTLAWEQNIAYRVVEWTPPRRPLPRGERRQQHCAGGGGACQEYPSQRHPLQTHPLPTTAFLGGGRG